MNIVILTGRLGADPETKILSDSSVTRLNIAVQRSYKTKDGTRPTDWFTVSFWGKRGQAMAKYLKKGNRVTIKGQIENRSYEKDGITHYTTEIIGNEFFFIDVSDNNESDGQENAEPSPSTEDLPF